MSYITKIITSSDDFDETILNQCFNDSLFLYDSTFTGYRFYYERSIGYIPDSGLSSEAKTAWLNNDTNRINYLRSTTVDVIKSVAENMIVQGSVNSNDPVFAYVIKDTDNSDEHIGYGLCSRRIPPAAPNGYLKIVYELMKGSTSTDVTNKFYQYWGDMRDDPSTSPSRLLGYDSQFTVISNQNSYNYRINSNTGFVQHGEGTLPTDGYANPVDAVILKYGWGSG